MIFILHIKKTHGICIGSLCFVTCRQPGLFLFILVCATRENSSLAEVSLCVSFGVVYFSLSNDFFFLTVMTTKYLARNT